MNGKKHCSIEVDPDGARYVTQIFDTFLAYNCSLQGMETRFKNQGIRTQSGKFFSTTQLHKMLTMPYCVEATPEVYDFYAAKGCIMDPGSPREMWDGSVGVIIYGRRPRKTKSTRRSRRRSGPCVLESTSPSCLLRNGSRCSPGLLRTNASRTQSGQCLS